MKLRGETSIGDDTVCLGLMGLFHSPDNGVKVVVSLSNGRIVGIISLIDSDISKKPIAHCASESLVGKLGFAQTSIYNRFLTDL